MSKKAMTLQVKIFLKSIAPIFFSFSGSHSRTPWIPLASKGGSPGIRGPQVGKLCTMVIASQNVIYTPPHNFTSQTPPQHGPHASL